MALGVLGLTPFVFWRMSLREFRAAQRGFFEGKETEKRQRWEVGRLTGWCSMAPHDTKRRIRNPKQLIEFPWEQPESVIRQIENLDEKVRKIGRFMDDKGNTYN